MNVTWQRQAGCLKGAAGTYSEDVFLTLVLAVLIGMAIGALVSVVAMSRGRSPADVEQIDPASAPTPLPVDSFPVSQMMAVLPGASLLVDGATGVVERATARAVSLGLVVADRVASEELRSLVAEVFADGATREHDVLLRRPALSGQSVQLRARAGKLSKKAVFVLVEDQSGVRRVDTVRRDFVANVSHELKTPIGALMLLSEAINDAAQDPAAVQKFSGRIQAECERLTRLIADLIDLSRIQGDQPLESARLVSVDGVVEEAVDAVRTAAATQQIEIRVGGTTGLSVFGVEDQLITAVRNLLSNALAYSQPRTNVAVGISAREGVVRISITDQGIGIASDELQRIFERFYRVDQARSRQTGGTGLGLSIVKHICHNHGGEVRVWSVPGEGSTFTLRLPQYQAEQEKYLAPDRQTAIDDSPTTTARSTELAKRNSV